MSSELAQIIAQKFIARGDAKAIQGTDGGYKPHKPDQKKPELYPWAVDDVDAHLAKTVTYGHYVLNTKNRCKLITFDIDLEEQGLLPMTPMPLEDDDAISAWLGSFEPCNPRELWRERAHPARPQIKRDFRAIIHEIADFVHTQMELPVAVAYSGNKGVHVYAFTGPIDAHDARVGADLVLDSLGFVPAFFPNGIRRAGTFKHAKHLNMAVEIYPKQDVIVEGGFGNLVRLPLGVNLKAPKDPTFFVDLTAPLNDLRPADPIWALTEGSLNPWKAPGE